MIDVALSFLGYIVLLVIGTAMAVFGLLQATHPAFQRWWYGTKWSNPKGKPLADANSDEYKNVVANMRMAGARGAGAGALAMMFSLEKLGGDILLSIAAVLYLTGVGTLRDF